MTPRRAQHAGAYALLGVVMACVAAMSWAGVYDFAVTVLHWTPVHAGMVPVSLDVAAMACAMLALDSISDGESGTAFRLLSSCFMGLSAFINWRTFLGTGNVSQELFFPSMSVLAYAMVHFVLAKVHRKTARAQHGSAVKAAPVPLPRYHALTWVPGIGHPVLAWKALSADLASRVTGPEPQPQPRPESAPEAVREPLGPEQPHFDPALTAPVPALRLPGQRAGPVSKGG